VSIAAPTVFSGAFELVRTDSISWTPETGVRVSFSRSTVIVIAVPAVSFTTATELMKVIVLAATDRTG
jgi:hypothetical protein